MFGISDLPNIGIVKNDSIVVYKDLSYITRSKNRTLLQVQAISNLELNEPSGFITGRIEKKIQTIINNWIGSINDSMRYNYNTKGLYPSFVTLTLPFKQLHSDKELNRLALTKFITYAKRNYGIINYLWRSERQKNGNLHYHILFDKYIHWKDIRNLWNSVLEPLGYLKGYYILNGSNDTYSKKILKDFNEDNELISDYLKNYDVPKDAVISPNSTDVKALKHITNVSKYISKYLSKDENYSKLKQLKIDFEKDYISESEYKEKRKPIIEAMQKNKIDARLWGCSDSLRNVKNLSFDIGTVEDNFIKKVIDLPTSKVIIHDNVVVIINDNLKGIIERDKQMKVRLERHYRDLYNNIYNNVGSGVVSSVVGYFSNLRHNVDYVKLDALASQISMFD